MPPVFRRAVTHVPILVLALGALFLALPAAAEQMPPGGPGGDSDSGVLILADNRDLDARLDNLTRNIRDGDSSYPEARRGFRNALAAALDLKSRSVDLPRNRAATLLLAAMRLQVQRCEELLRATEYEEEYGLQAAAPLWRAEVSTYNRYREAVARARRAYGL